MFNGLTHSRLQLKYATHVFPLVCIVSYLRTPMHGDCTHVYTLLLPEGQKSEA